MARVIAARDVNGAQLAVVEPAPLGVVEVLGFEDHDGSPGSPGCCGVRTPASCNGGKPPHIGDMALPA
jgi:hypothetical protein